MTPLPRQQNGRVRSSVLRRIRRDHIERALDALDAGVGHSFGPSTDYDLRSRGRTYPPKAVLGVAAEYALGEQLTPDDFSAGEGSTCFAVLREQGYEIVPKEQVLPPEQRARTWIFQGNPSTFDMDGYLARRLDRICWMVNQHVEEIHAGDRAYLWRSGGKNQKSVPGVIARCTVLSDPWLGMDDPNAADLWQGSPPMGDAWRVWLRVDEVANSKGVVKRDWLKEDPVCRDLPILRQAAATNFPVPDRHVDRLNRLWNRTGVDWTREESIAGLWAYDVTYGGEVSKSDDSPVTDVALRIGRVKDGVYNKVMNFRALDPRDERDGLQAGGAVDQEVWSEFYDARRGRLRSEDLERAFLDLWGDVHPAVAAASTTHASPVAPPAPIPAPSRARMTTFRLVRDSSVTEWVKQVHDYRCQACGQRFDSPCGPVAEGAHIRPLGAEHQGPDDVRNVLCLCPTHHALFDRGAFVIAQDFILRSRHARGLLERLAMQDGHEVGSEFIEYHRRIWSEPR